MKRVLTAVLVLSLLLLAAACGGSTSGSSDTSSTNGGDDSSAKKWVKVATLKGSTNKTSPSFTLKGGEQKLAWTVKGGDMIAMGIYVEEAGTDIMQDGGFPAAMPDKAGKDSTRLSKDAGKYVIIVNSANCDWTCTISELR